MNGKLVTTSIDSELDSLASERRDWGSELDSLARQIAAISGTIRVVFGWHREGRQGLACWPQDRGWREIAAFLIRLVDRRTRFTPGDGSLITLTPDELRPLFKAPIAVGSIGGIAALSERDSARVVTVLITPGGNRNHDAARLAGLAGQHAAQILATQAALTSRDFWRARASMAGERLATRTSELNGLMSEWTDLQAMIGACLKLRSRNRLAGVAAAIARQYGFGAWLAVVAHEGELRIAGASPAVVPVAEVAGSMIAEAVRTGSVMRRDASSPDGFTKNPFPGWTSCLCVPFPNGGFAFAANSEIGAPLAMRVGSAIRTVQPIIERWFADEELVRLRRLVRNLALRMFTAVDAERQRIARDLHDHQAQLLAAARVALTADPAEARSILKQLDDALRLRVRELRPASLGRSNLREALRYEMTRLNDAGTKAVLHYPARMKPFARSVQQLCYEIAREAFSNVLRHAGATLVEITVERRRGHAILRVSDDGRGFAENRRSDEHSVGIGVLGLTERVELMGGKLRIERTGGMTRLSASIPEP